MKLSIVMPSHNTGAHINANILNLATMGGEDIEVIIRDNSGNADKRDFLSRIREPGCRILSVDECPGAENAVKLMEAAAGEFVFFVSDDDYTNPYALPSILSELDRIRGNPEIVGATGIFIVDEPEKTAFYRFDGFDVPRAADRFDSFLKTKPSIFQFSPLRLSMLKDVWSFSFRMPVYLSYHDWLMNCMMLMHGRITCIDRYIYQYYNSNWTTPETSLATDARYFRNAGLDTSGVRLQWLIACFEGARTFMDKYTRIDMPPAQRQELAGFWFRHFFQSFVHTWMREAPDARFDAQALTVAEKWRGTREIRLDAILTDIAEYYALSSPEIAQRYYDFWK